MKDTLLAAQSLFVETRWSPTSTPSASQQVCGRCFVGGCPSVPLRTHQGQSMIAMGLTPSRAPRHPDQSLLTAPFPAGHWSWDPYRNWLTSVKSFLKYQLFNKASGGLTAGPPSRFLFSVRFLFLPLRAKCLLIIWTLWSFVLLLQIPFDLEIPPAKGWALYLLCPWGLAHSRPSAKICQMNEPTRILQKHRAGRGQGSGHAALNCASVFKIFLFQLSEIKAESSAVIHLNWLIKP